MKKIFILFTSLILTSCAGLVVVGATGLIVYDKRHFTTIEQDTRIFHLIHTQLVKNPQFKNSRIAVSSFNNTVLLVGQTPAASLRVLAEKVAQKTPYVRRVYNEITIGYPVSFTQRAEDSWITSQIRSNMLAKKGLASGSIRVVTENGIVYLLGIVKTRQANLAVDIARNVRGVRKVVKIFQYLR
jgi:osmotically-inducible protein OsmY